MIKVDDQLIEMMRKMSVKEPENYLEDYIFLTYDYAFMKGEQGEYRVMTDLLRECLDGLMRMKIDDSQITEIAFGIHDLMIELVEVGHYDMADEIHDLLGKMLEIYQIKLKRS